MSQIDAILDEIRAKGERVTFQRRLVIEALCDYTGHVTINDMQRYVQNKHTRQDLQDPTIYRILQWLKDLQLVSQTDIGASGIVYELLRQPHHHLICLKCGTVMDLDDNCLGDLRQDYLTGTISMPGSTTWRFMVNVSSVRRTKCA